jgi:hypothetical protein
MGTPLCKAFKHSICCRLEAELQSEETCPFHEMQVLFLNGFRRTDGGEESVVLLRGDEQMGETDYRFKRNAIIIEGKVLAPVPAVEILDFVEELFDGFWIAPAEIGVTGTAESTLTVRTGGMSCHNRENGFRQKTELERRGSEKRRWRRVSRKRRGGRSGPDFIPNRIEKIGNLMEVLFSRSPQKLERRELPSKYDIGIRGSDDAGMVQQSIPCISDVGSPDADAPTSPMGSQDAGNGQGGDHLPLIANRYSNKTRGQFLHDRRKAALEEISKWISLLVINQVQESLL